MIDLHKQPRLHPKESVSRTGADGVNGGGEMPQLDIRSLRRRSPLHGVAEDVPHVVVEEAGEL
jgi:hypothetical protein